MTSKSTVLFNILYTNKKEEANLLTQGKEQEAYQYTYARHQLLFALTCGGVKEAKEKALRMVDRSHPLDFLVDYDARMMVRLFLKKTFHLDTFGEEEQK